MKWIDNLFHRHRWKLISAHVSGNEFEKYSASATLECEDCGKRVHHTNQRTWISDRLPSRNAGKVWIESLLPSGHKEVTLKETK